jgi:hypothetical protein
VPLYNNLARVGTGWNATIFEQDQPIWHFYGYKTAGIDPATGSPNFVKKDGTITNAAGVTADDMYHSDQGAFVHDEGRE